MLVFRLDYPNDSDRKVVLICGLLLGSLKSSLKVIESSSPRLDFDGYVKGSMICVDEIDSFRNTKTACTVMYQDKRTETELKKQPQPLSRAFTAF